MESIRLVARNGEAVRQALERGEVLHLDTASEESTDEFLLFASNSGLLEQWAAGFPDARRWAEISSKVLLAAESAARFASRYSPRKTGYVLRSARVLGALGDSLEVLEEGAGLSGRGTGAEQLYSGDVLRKMLGKAETQAASTKEDQAAALPGGAAVKVRDRARAARSNSRSWMKRTRRRALLPSRAAGWSGTTERWAPAYWSTRQPVLGVASTFWMRRRSWSSWSAAQMNVAAW